MFFMAGVYSKTKKLEYHEFRLCGSCSKYGRYEAYMEYSVLSLFFIPVFKFNKKIYVRTTCCNNSYLITNKEKSKMIEDGQTDVFLKDEDLQLIQTGLNFNIIKCNNCGFETEGSHKFCPNCGNSLK